MMEASPQDSLAENDPVSAFRLYRFGCTIIAGACLFFIIRAGGDFSLQLLLGLGILVLASLPALLWAKNQRTWFPAFEISTLTCIAFYAIPLLNKHTELRLYPDAVTAEAAFLVLLYLGMANLGFAMTRKRVQPSFWAATSLLPESSFRFIPVGMVLSTTYIYVETFTSLIPHDLLSILRALFFGIGTMATFVLARLWGLGQLRQDGVALFLLNLALQIIFLFSQLYLITGICLIALALIAYISARRRIPWFFICILVPVLALLHRGKSDMRAAYWEQKRPPPTVSELPAYFSEWVNYSLASIHSEKGEDQKVSLFERASLIQMLCLSVDRVPSSKPYLGGESYVDLPAQFIPRVLWPEKPSGLLANVRLALYFDLVSIESSTSVSIAFGMISEAYVNFGFIGVATLGLLMGISFKRIAILAQDAPQFSALGILMILLTAWSFQVEQVMATWISSLFQATVICIGIPLVYRQFSAR